MPTDRGTWFMYTPENGEIYGTYANSYENMLIDLADKAHIKAPNGDIDISNKYVDNGEVKIRPNMNLTVIGATITGIPEDSLLFLGEQIFPINDGEADIEGYEGAVRIICFPYMDEVFTI
jgi:hypothetical protein